MSLITPLLSSARSLVEEVSAAAGLVRVLTSDQLDAVPDVAVRVGAGVGVATSEPMVSGVPVDRGVGVAVRVAEAGVPEAVGRGVPTGLGDAVAPARGVPGLVVPAVAGVLVPAAAATVMRAVADPDTLNALSVTVTEMVYLPGEL
jgi:hypothetical protein